MNLSRMRCSATGWLVGLLSLPGLLAGCAGQMKSFASQEDFSSTATYSRLFDATAAQTCEAARRALLSQGYLISTATQDLVEGRKSFQPEPEAHLQMEIRVVCAPDTPDGTVSLGFVTALQDVYALKKSNNSASLGVGALGSVSLPFSSSSDAMVKVASQTITADVFYERFFDLVKRYLVVLDEP
ncbi:MAG: putative lipoprotein [Polaromonas sp.]|nr:putative lipoprotein [Polaromonas sp.]